MHNSIRWKVGLGLFFFSVECHMLLLSCRMTTVDNCDWESSAVGYTAMAKAANVESVRQVGQPDRKSVSDTQTNALIATIQGPFMAHLRRQDKAVPMDKPLTQYLRTYWEGHLSARAVRLFMMMRFPSWVVDKSTKVALIDRLLMESEPVFPCPYQIIADWAASHLVVDAFTDARIATAVAAAVAAALQGVG